MKQLGIPGIAGVLCGELIVDLFAGGGGASEGITQALGRPPDVAVNHDAHSIEMHALNHPATEHYQCSVYEVDPAQVCAGRPVGLLWLSPDCRHFSRAKGGAPVSPAVRSLAWVAVDWAKAVRPRVITLENVTEFQTWGPLLDDGRPDPARSGETFREFIASLKSLGYAVEWRALVAADFGAPTIRKRLFLVARCDGVAIAWPEPTHGKGRALPWRSAAECIDFSLPCPSIFDRKKPLAETTCRRIAAGLVRYVLQGTPFLVPTLLTTERHALVAPYVVPCAHGGDHPRGHSVTQPVQTITKERSFAVVSAFLAKHYTGVVGSSLATPLGTVTQVDHHSLVAANLVGIDNRSNGDRDVWPATAPLTTVTRENRHALVAAFLVQYYSEGKTSGSLSEPMGAVVTKARHGLVTVEIEGQEFAVVDIGLRMMQPRELALAQGFPSSYILTGTQAQQVARIGNSVCPPVAEALVRANFCGRKVVAS